MLIDLTDIFKMQVKLDNDIHAKHGVNYQSVIEEIKLALLVELAELANEVRSFKFWSNKSSSERNVIVEEYVDGIHFLTSMCIREKIIAKFEINDVSHIKDKKIITKLFNSLFEDSNKLFTKNEIIS
jgi:dimeric dUTPase (all-alpha-NTP-PPase superfamily)